MRAVRSLLVVLAAVLQAGCSDGALRMVVDPGAPPTPTGSTPDPHGEPPDWSDCAPAFHGTYLNTAVDGDEPIELLSFERWDPSLDFGGDWWPVDDGLPGDPAGFAVTWRAWLRAWSHTEWQLAVSALDVAEVFIDGELVLVEDTGELVPSLASVPLDAGQHTLEVRFEHASEGLDGGFSLRPLGGDVSVCPGE